MCAKAVEKALANVFPSSNPHTEKVLDTTLQDIRQSLKVDKSRALPHPTTSKRKRGQACESGAGPSSEDPDEDLEIDVEKEDESLNMALLQQLTVIQQYFPSLVPTPEPAKGRKVIRPEVQETVPTVSSLPLHPLIAEKLDSLHEEIQSDKRQATSTVVREQTSLPIGVFPRAIRLHDRYQPTGKAEFEKNFKLDSQLNGLFFNRRMPQPGKAKILDFPRAGRLVSDAKKSLATLSWSTWFTETSAALLKDMYSRLEEKTLSSKATFEMLQVALNLVCSATESNLATVNHIFSGLAVSSLAQRDFFLQRMDKDLPEETKESLRAVPFSTPTLFAGEVPAAASILKDVKQTRTMDKPLTITVQAPASSSSFKKPQQVQRRVVFEAPWQGGQSSFRPSRGRGRGQGGQKSGGRGRGNPYFNKRGRGKKSSGRGGQ